MGGWGHFDGEIVLAPLIEIVGDGGADSAAIVMSFAGVLTITRRVGRQVVGVPESLSRLVLVVGWSGVGGRRTRVLRIVVQWGNEVLEV